MAHVYDNKNSRNDWGASGVKRRDFRASKPDDVPIPHRSSKDVKKWCRGKLGRLHDYKLVKEFRWLFSFDILQCQKCGRKTYKSLKKGP